MDALPGLAPVSSHLELAWHLNELGLLRQAIAAMALDAGLPDEARDALTLAAFEAATNVIRHVKCPLPDATLQVFLENTDPAVNLSLYYLGEPFSPDDTLPDFSGDTEGGFGLYIIENSVDEVIYDTPVPGVCRIWLCKRKESSHVV
ncbi:MAG: ATP-binding protein [Pseudomonadota bacterium]